jgi:hypothetical protein
MFIKIYTHFCEHFEVNAMQHLWEEKCILVKSCIKMLFAF